MLVVAGTGVFFVFASGTVGEVQIEFFRLCFGICTGLDLDYNGEVVAFRKGLFRNENVALFRKLHPGGVGAIATDHGDGLLANGLGFSVVGQCCDLHFPVFGDKELQVWLNCEKNTTAIGTGFSFRMVVIVVMFVVGSFLVNVAFFFSMVVTIVFVMFMIVVIVVMTFLFGAGCAKKRIGRGEYYR
jgi:hypothetical protein